MGKIVYLMGKSSSGKDTIYRRLLQDDSLHLKKIVRFPRKTLDEIPREWYNKYR